MEEDIFKQQLLDEASRRNQRDNYVPIPSDQVDVMLAEAVNSCPYSVRIQRHGDGQYTYGTKKIHASILKDGLVIRVDGGYRVIDEFLRVYAETEAKLQQVAASQRYGKSATVAPGKGSPRRSGTFKSGMSPKSFRAGSPNLGGSLK